MFMFKKVSMPAKDDALPAVDHAGRFDEASQALDETGAAEIANREALDECRGDRCALVRKRPRKILTDSSMEINRTHRS